MLFPCARTAVSAVCLVAIPFYRSVCTRLRLARVSLSPSANHNPFMNQVYFYRVFAYGLKSVLKRYGLNPFMNQVYFYTVKKLLKMIGNLMCLNPFMNQVYFYIL